jgi:Ti-type conjugative transfer relaxase TraA
MGRRSALAALVFVMAIYHLAMKPISRGGGRSAVAAAAYRSAERLTNERDGLTHDFRHRRGVEHSEIILPKGAEADFARDRSRLWNEAEAAEKRKDGRVAREIEVALPHELDADERLALAREFVQGLADRYGVVVDLAVHSPHGGTDVRNHHAHLLLTTRKVEKDGLGEKSEFELENKKLAALGRPTSHDQLRDVRADWEERANRHLGGLGQDIRIDHRSHQARGIEIEPTSHMGVHATQMERRGKSVTRGRLDQDQGRRNARAIREKPEEVLSLITHEKSVFDRADVARALHRYVDDPDAFQEACAKVMASPQLVELRPELKDDLGRTLEPARYSTTDMVAVERQMAMSADRMGQSQTFAVSPRHVERALSDRAFLTGEQREAVRHITAPERLNAVVGLAGAGKSTLLGAAREAWMAQGYEVWGAALAGKAAEGLEESSGISSRTLASWERRWERGTDLLNARSVLVIDEAGMVGSRQLSKVLACADQAGAKVVLVGDPEQLQPIGPGAAFRAITERVGFAELGEIRRQDAPWQRKASGDFARHRTGQGLQAYAERGAVHLLEDLGAARGAMVRDLLADMEARPEGSRLLLAHRRADVADLNEEVRAGRKARGELTGEVIYQTTEGERAFAPGDRILFRENHRELGVKNGMLGEVEAVAPGRIEVRLDATRGPVRGPATGRSVSISMADYAAVDHGYAVTIHKAQGASVDRAYVLASRSMDRHLSYVAMTRHRFKDLDALAGRLSRAGLKETTLDYAQRRGIDEPILVPRALRRELEARAPRPGAAPGPGAGRDPVAEPSVRRGLFDGLSLRPRAERPRLEEVGDLSLRSAPPRPSLGAAAERYAEALEAARKMRERGLPVMARQMQELRAAGEALDGARPGARRDLISALRHEPEAARAMRELKGSKRGLKLAGAIGHEERVRRDPALQAHRLVKEWKRLETQLDRLDVQANPLTQSPAKTKLMGRMKAIARVFKARPELGALAGAPGLQIGPLSLLARVIRAPSLAQAEVEIDMGKGPDIER